MSDTPETPINEELLGKEAYRRLQNLQGMLSPYGPVLGERVREYLKIKLGVSPQERRKWLLEELKLNIAKKGQFDYDGPAWIAATALLVQTATYGAEDYVPVLRHALAALETEGNEIPPKIKQDIELVCRWMKSSYGLDI